MRENSTRTPFRLLALPGLALLGILLAACGAEIDTVLTVEDDGSGSRVMTLELDADDAGELNGGVKEINQAISEAKPDGIEYEGAKKKSDGSITAAFRIDFDSPEQYKEIVERITRGDAESGLTPEFTVADSTFLKGINISEGYSSGHLLDWAFDALVDAKVIDESARSNAYELGSSVLVFEDEKIEAGSYISHRDIEDRGFSAVYFNTTAQDAENWQRTARLDFPALEGSLPIDDYRAHLEAALPQGGTITEDAAGFDVAWTGTPEEISGGTNALLNSEEAVFDVHTAADETDPASILLTITSSADCSAVCTTSYRTDITDNITPMAGVEPESAVVNSSSSPAALFTVTPPVQDVTARAEFTGESAPTNIEVEISVANADAALVGDGFAELFRPHNDRGVLEVIEDDITTRYVVRFTGETAASDYAEWASGGFFDVQPTPSSNWWYAENAYTADFNLAGILGTHPMNGELTARVNAPAGSTIDAETTFSGTVDGSALVSSESTYLTFVAGGLTFGAWVTLIGGALLLIAAAILVFVFRARLAPAASAGLAAARATAKGASAYAGTLASTATANLDGDSTRPALDTFASAPVNRPAVDLLSVAAQTTTARERGALEAHAQPIAVRARPRLADLAPAVPANRSHSLLDSPAISSTQAPTP